MTWAMGRECRNGSRQEASLCVPPISGAAARGGSADRERAPRGLRVHSEPFTTAGTLICSRHAPDSPISVGQVMGRNKLIYTLSEVTVPVAADHASGGLLRRDGSQCEAASVT